MKKLTSIVESSVFQNIIMGVIVLNALVMGLQTSAALQSSIGPVLSMIDTVCLWIFVVELLLKIIVYRQRFFKDGWNIFDFILVGISFLSGMSFMSSFRIFRIFRVLKSLKALKSVRSFRLVSGLKHLRIIIEAIFKSIPGICWSGILLLLIYYVFGLIGVSLFGEAFPDWFGSIGKSVYTLFQVMTLESWSMGISRPVMEVYSWAWCYFVPFVLISSFIMMNVVVGIVVNSISEVTAAETEVKEKESEEKTEETATPISAEEAASLKEEIRILKEQLDRIEGKL